VDEARLKDIPLFSRLTKRQRTQLARHVREVEIPTGEHLVDEGEHSFEFFVIVEGSAAVVGGGTHLTDLGPGDFLGEIGLVQHKDRTASVIATKPIKAIVMDETGFREMEEHIPAVAREIDAAIEERLERDRLFRSPQG
jgi:CRP/FNR family transcriptional regulator, cyclic AMP receptor protein